jgi:hypothetical protein
MRDDELRPAIVAFLGDNGIETACTSCPSILNIEPASW